MNGQKHQINHDLWQKLDSLTAPHAVTYIWVKSRAQTAGNNQAAKLAFNGFKQAQDAR
jgi:ribonuclease HI